MNSHKNARLTPKGRALLVRRVLEEGLRPAEAAQAAGVSVRTTYKWLARYRQEGEAGLQDRSSRPHRCPHQTATATREAVLTLRRLRCTYRSISQQLGLAPSTVGRHLKRAGLNRLSQLEPPRPVNRYVHDHPGDLLHLDIKRLGRFRRPGHRITGDRRQASPRAGWEFVHVAIDDHSRVSHATLYPDECAASAWRALFAAVRYFRSLGVAIRRLLTDNGSCYRSAAFARACRRLGLRHRLTRPYTPRTNGKAERFIQTALREWAYARSYDSSTQRAEFLPRWLHQYNWHRPHASLGYLPPVSALGLAVNNLVGLHT